MAGGTVLARPCGPGRRLAATPRRRTGSALLCATLAAMVVLLLRPPAAGAVADCADSAADLGAAVVGLVGNCTVLHAGGGCNASTALSGAVKAAADALCAFTCSNGTAGTDNEPALAATMASLGLDADLNCSALTDAHDGCNATSGFFSLASAHCPVTCGLACCADDDAGLLTATTAQGQPVPSCAAFQSLGQCESSNPLVQALFVHCPATCGTCDAEVVAALACPYPLAPDPASPTGCGFACGAFTALQGRSISWNSYAFFSLLSLAGSIVMVLTFALWRITGLHNVENTTRFRFPGYILIIMTWMWLGVSIGNTLQYSIGANTIECDSGHIRTREPRSLNACSMSAILIYFCGMSLVTWVATLVVYLLIDITANKDSKSTTLTTQTVVVCHVFAWVMAVIPTLGAIGAKDFGSRSEGFCFIAPSSDVYEHVVYYTIPFAMAMIIDVLCTGYIIFYLLRRLRLQSLTKIEHLKAMVRLFCLCVFGGMGSTFLSLQLMIWFSKHHNNLLSEDNPDKVQCTIAAFYSSGVNSFDEALRQCDAITRTDRTLAMTIFFTIVVVPPVLCLLLVRRKDLLIWVLVASYLFDSDKKAFKYNVREAKAHGMSKRDFKRSKSKAYAEHRLCDSKRKVNRQTSKLNPLRTMDEPSALDISDVTDMPALLNPGGYDNVGDAAVPMVSEGSGSEGLVTTAIPGSETLPVPAAAAAAAAPSSTADDGSDVRDGGYCFEHDLDLASSVELGAGNLVIPNVEVQSVQSTQLNASADRDSKSYLNVYPGLQQGLQQDAAARRRESLIDKV